jgi:diguanylate cyclase (GGDEF)-like protein
LLFPLLHLGWLDGIAFSITAAVLATLTFAGIRVAISVAQLRKEPPPIDVRDEGPEASGRSHDVPRTVERGDEAAVHRPVARELVLEAERDAALREGSAQRDLLKQLERAQRIARLGSWDWHRDEGTLFFSKEAYRILGTDAAGLPPRLQAVLRMAHADDRAALRRWMFELARGGTPEGLDVRMLSTGTELRHVHLLGEAVRDAGGRVTGVAGTLQDATERTRAIQRIHRLAYFDVLTELPNRSRFHEKMAETLELAKRQATSFAIMFLDLDQFKRINDTLGHSVGDDLLRIIAQRLTRSMRPDDMAGAPPVGAERDVCRQGGDEFIVLLNGVANEHDAAKAANRLLATLAQPISIGAQDIFVSASIGIVLYPRDGNDLDTLLKNADVAMYHAKAHGRNCFFFYQDSMRAASAQRLSLENDLRKALEEEQFELYYQPQIELPSCRIVGVEALIRWNHPTLGLLTPTHFIPVAEEAGLIMAIWEWVLVAALIQHNAWVEEGLAPVTIGVNLSSVQFSDPSLAARVQEIAGVVDVPLDHLEFEVTESMLLKDFDGALKTLTALRAMGVKIAIDDFGTGYSSLSYLRRLPLDKLKLDQSFTRDAQQNEVDVAITRAIIAMAQSLKLAVVAEGVETQAQIDLLLSLGCTVVQGFLLGRPLPAQETSQLLHENAPSAAAMRAADASWGLIVQPKAGQRARRPASS